MKGMGDILKQAQKMQRRMMEIQEELEALEVVGEAGGGMVKVTASGKGEIKALKINPEAVDAEEVEMLEDTILAAIGDTMEKVRKVAGEKMSAVTGGFPGMGGKGMPGF